MAAQTYSPTSHAASVRSTVLQGGAANAASVTGLSPGVVFAELTDPLAPTTIFLPTGLTSDGFPGAMLPFTTSPLNSLSAASATVS